jgi:hypothetical protein
MCFEVGLLFLERRDLPTAVERNAWVYASNVFMQFYTVLRSSPSSILEMETADSAGTLAPMYQTPRRYILEDRRLNTHGV